MSERLRKRLDSKIKAEELGLRRWPKGWAGGTLGQIYNSSKALLEHSALPGGPRGEAALRVEEFVNKLKKQTP